MNLNPCKHELIGPLIDVARKAAAWIVNTVSSDRGFHAERKGDGSWLLSLDLECDHLIRSELEGIAPVLSEEARESHTLLNQFDRYFLVDPIDGTSVCRRFPKLEGGQIGFGPLIGVVENHRLTAAAFLHLPRRSLIVAERGAGCYLARLTDLSNPSEDLSFHPVKPVSFKSSLDQCVGLVALSDGQDLIPVIDLKLKGIIDNVYRFGGFANDTFRLLMGEEHFQIQRSVKSWDFVAAFLAHEIGYRVVMDPYGERVGFEDWSIKANNPILVVAPDLASELLDELKRAAARRAK